MLIFLGLFLIFSLVLPNLAKAEYEKCLEAAELKYYETTLKEWRGDADQEHVKAQNNFRKLYQNGWGVTEDYTEVASKAGKGEL